ncbi:MAG: DUF4118 domain-containing protein, partial [Acidobacteriota bacterium]|nr:DUF4118 domain-containing protein [Acidobacteriota bacterium]
MNLFTHPRKLTLQILVAALLTLAVTAALAWAHAGEVTAAMGFLVLVVWTGAQAGIAPSLFTAILCSLAFDYFFLLPYHTFVLAGVPEWIAMSSFLASSIAAGGVAERARHQTDQAERRREDVERLYKLSQEMMLYDHASQLRHALPQLIRSIFGLGDVALYFVDQDAWNSTTGSPLEVDPVALEEMMIDHAASTSAIGDYSSHPLQLGLRCIGLLAWKPANLSPELATAITAQISIALTRAIAIETTARAEAARESEYLRTALIDSVTHELRTPLTSIRAAATTLLQDEGLDQETRRDLASVVDEESARLDTLIGQTVEMAEIDANTIQPNLELLDPRHFLEQVVEQSHRIVAKHHVVIQSEGAQPARFDPRLLARVFRHLIENATRYAPPGTQITLTCESTPDHLQFSVADRGPGIDEADLPHVFEKLYRGKTGIRVGKGTGMGLAIARAIVNAHHGEIKVESNRNSGTRFVFWVPFVEQSVS